MLRIALAHTVALDPAMIESIGLNVPVLLFTLLTCTLTAIAFSLFPFANNSPHLTETLSAGECGSTSGSLLRSKKFLLSE